MKNYKCQKNLEHDGVEAVSVTRPAAQDSKIICAECGEFIDWASSKDLIQLNKDIDAKYNNLKILHQTMLDQACEHAKAKIAENEELRGEIRALSSNCRGESALKRRFKRRMELYKAQLDNLESGAE